MSHAWYFASAWIAAEKPPEPEQQPQIVKAPPVDADGHRVVNHGEGW
jgi:hypothetical protein